MLLLLLLLLLLLTSSAEQPRLRGSNALNSSSKLSEHDNTRRSGNCWMPSSEIRLLRLRYSTCMVCHAAVANHIIVMNHGRVGLCDRYMFLKHCCEESVQCLTVVTCCMLSAACTRLHHVVCLPALHDMLLVT